MGEEGCSSVGTISMYFNGAVEWADVHSNLIIAMATAVLALYAGIQVCLLRKDLRESKASRNASVVLHVLAVMDDLRDKWHLLYKLPPNHITWNEEAKKLADEVCVQLQRVAYLAETGLVEGKYIIENYATVYHNCWRRLRRFVGDYRDAALEPRGLEEGAFQRRHLEQFAQKCEKYLRDHKLPGKREGSAE